MKIIKTKIKDLLVFESVNFYDNRGYFREVLLEKIIKKRFKFTVISSSKKNVLRGLHMQKKFPQGKYISVIKGKILDVVVDCRKKSKTFGKYFKIIISGKNSKSLYVPPGFIHGFVGLEKENIVLYSCTNYRNKQSELGVKWNDKNLNINWGIKKPILSKKDKNNLHFNKVKF
mgnify:FL=1|tara:strand:+ start:508 stop:1026 length:519 start_codon:yes stop_codon:yes gene_type:complete